MFEKRIKVRRLNTSLFVPESQAKLYLNKGYSIIGEDGAVVKEAVPNEFTELKIAFEEHTRIIEELKAENAELKAKLEKPKKTTKKVEEKVEVEETTETV
mgnify:CR=1 FL=1